MNTFYPSNIVAYIEMQKTVQLLKKKNLKDKKILYIRNQLLQFSSENEKVAPFLQFFFLRIKMNTVSFVTKHP